jgi:hypothetical protein
MAAPLNIPELVAPQEAPASAVEQAKCMENAAKLVGGFAQKCAPSALDALLAACNAESPGKAAEQALAAAGAATAQAETLMAEVERFMSLTRPRG